MDYFNAPSQACKPRQVAETAASKGNRTVPAFVGHVSIYYTSQERGENAGKAKSPCITMGFCNAYRYTSPQRNHPKIEETGLRNEAPTEQLKPNQGDFEVSND